MVNFKQLEILTKVLKSKDRKFAQYISCASKITLYKYTDEWIETNFIGALYFYNTITPTKHKFIILNTVKEDHFIINIDNSQYFSIPNFMVFRSNCIYGILFAESVDYSFLKQQIEEKVLLRVMDEEMFLKLKNLKVNINKSLQP